jgi:adenine-specific DNA methylase
MLWDYAEVNPFNASSGGAEGNIDWITRVIVHESHASRTVAPAKVIRGDGAAIPLANNSIDCVVTDPPYFDAIAYADISDIFYVWLKRAVGDEFAEGFSTPQTPKAEEATAFKHRHGGDNNGVERHFTQKLAACFRDSHRLCRRDGVISVMFAHQSTKAWTALVNALFAVDLNITATFPIDTERKARTLALGRSTLESSITVVCRPRVATAPGSFKDVRREIERVVKESVKRFWDYGFRGADLIVACYGPAVGEFGKYERVERGDGQQVTVPELLQLVREAALKAIAGEFTGDELSRLYFVWANMYGVAEQAWDDVRLVVQVGGDAKNAMDVARGRGLFVVDGSTSRLAVLADRADRPHLGDDNIDPLIDQLHRAMLLWKAEDRAGLVQYLHGHDLGDHVGFWRLAQALFEVMPRDAEDWKLVSALLGERNTLRTEIKRREAALAGAPGLFDGQEE